MIGLSTITSTIALTIRNVNSSDHFVLNGLCIQFVRWKRKPIWLPRAKTKLFKIAERPVLPVEEFEELKRLNNNYRTYIKSLRCYIIKKEEYNTNIQNITMSKESKDQDFLKCYQKNEEWNQLVAVEREKRFVQEREARRNQIKNTLEAKNQRDEKLFNMVDEEIKEAKEQSKTFITAANIDEAINNTLSTIVDHNAAIDMHGNFYTEIKTVSNAVETAEDAKQTMEIIQ